MPLLLHNRSVLDDLDLGLVHALHIDGRAALARIAQVLGVSSQTVTRRFQRLQRDAGLRVVASPCPASTGPPHPDGWCG